MIFYYYFYAFINIFYLYTIKIEYLNNYDFLKIYIIIIIYNLIYKLLLVNMLN